MQFNKYPFLSEGEIRRLRAEGADLHKANTKRRIEARFAFQREARTREETDRL